MRNDEQEIRQLVDTWLSASKSGDVDTILSLMSDDAVFLVPARPAMRKEDFAAAARPGPDSPRFEGTCKIQEIRILGEWAFMWAWLTVVTIPPGGGQSKIREGHTLTILKKQNERWVIARDANMLAPVPA